MKRSTADRSQYVQDRIRFYEQAINENRKLEWWLERMIKSHEWNENHGYKFYAKKIENLKEQRIKLLTALETFVIYWYGKKLNNK